MRTLPDGRLLLTLAVIIFASPATATTVEELQAQGRLSINASLSPAENVVAGQKLALVIEIGTDRWFTGGTKLAIPEVAGLVILQTEQFASNASEIRDTENWVLQRWTLDVYPQRAGDFSIPAVRASIRVSTEEAGNVSGDLLSPSTSFSAALPAGVQPDQHWVSAPSFTVSQTFDHDLEGLAIGDAFERELRFEASDVMAMMLPEFVPDTQPGLGIYRSPPELENTSNRGEVRAVRKQRISYIVEKNGDYRLPGQEFLWWDTSAGELRLLSLDEIRFTVGEPGVADSMGIDPELKRKLLAACAALLGLAIFALLLWRYFPRSVPTPLAEGLRRVRESWRAWRNPALPAELNPGSNAAERKA